MAEQEQECIRMLSTEQGPPKISISFAFQHTVCVCHFLIDFLCSTPWFKLKKKASKNDKTTMNPNLDDGEDSESIDPENFFNKDAQVVAKDLLGKVLQHKIDDIWLSGI